MKVCRGLGRQANRVRRGSSGAAWLLGCGVALGCVVARRVRHGSVGIVRRLAVKQARVRLLARYHMEVQTFSTTVHSRQRAKWLRQPW